MFITKKRYELEKRSFELDLKTLNDKYWNLYHKHERLMIHLGLYENVLSGVQILKKGGPDK